MTITNDGESVILGLENGEILMLEANTLKI